MTVDEALETLQVHPNAEPEVIDAAYKKLAAKYHPDRNASPDAHERLIKLNRAREVLRLRDIHTTPPSNSVRSNSPPNVDRQASPVAFSNRTILIGVVCLVALAALQLWALPVLGICWLAYRKRTELLQLGKRAMPVVGVLAITGVLAIVYATRDKRNSRPIRTTQSTPALPPSAIASGSAVFADDGRVWVYAVDGSLGTIPTDKLSVAQAQGYRLATRTEVNARLKEKAEATLRSTLGIPSLPQPSPPVPALRANPTSSFEATRPRPSDTAPPR